MSPHTITVVPTELLIYPAFLVACVIAVAAEDLLIRRMTRDTPTGETAGCTAECEEWDGWGW